MKRLVYIAILLVLFPASADAVKRYITDVEITLRTGQGIDHKIIALVKSGQEVAVLEEGDQWTRVRLPNGTEGWVVSRFLTDEKPSGILLEELRQKHDALLAHADSPLKEIIRLKEKNKTLRFEIASLEKTLNDLKKSYEALKKESKELLKVKSDYNKVTSQLAKQREKADKIEEELLKLEQRQIFRWILVGAGVLFVGFITGASARRQRRRPSLL
jgi:SH3 domain protein